MLREIKTKTRHYFVDKQNRKQGEFKSYFNNGQLWEHAFLRNGIIHGEYKKYYYDGQLCEHFFCQNGYFHGEYKEYHKNGYLKHSTFFYQDIDLKVNPNTLTDQDKVYIMMSGRLPPRD